MAAWRSARVFISSTFKDMQAERDWLVRFVFPRLRDQLARNRIHLVDVDLRWGITSEDNVIDACTGIIDDCRPHFLAMLGGRYGYVPPGDDLSITHREIRHALARDEPDRPHLLFFARADASNDAIAGEARKQYLEIPDSPPHRRLNDLRAEIAAAGYRCDTYECRWDAKEQRLVNLESFGHAVYSSLLASIEAGLPSAAAGVDAGEEQEATEAFIEARTAGFVVGNRGPMLDALERFCFDEEAGTACLAGESGTGKSALLAYFYRSVLEPAEARERARPLKVIPVFAGASPDSTDVRSVMRRVLLELRGASGDEVPDSFEELKDHFFERIERAAAHADIVLILDGVDQLSARHQGRSLHWLPQRLPEGVRVIVSAPPGQELDVMRARRPEPMFMTLEPLDDAGASEICDQFLAAHQKRFEPRQRAALLAKAHARRPLYLIVALEELRTLGRYEEIDARIAELPGRIPDLFAWLLRRLNQDWIFGAGADRGLVERYFASLYASRAGLRSDELVASIAPGDPAGHVSALERLVRPYLMQAGELLAFQHVALRHAVRDVFLREPEQLRSAHQQLAAFFQTAADRRADDRWKDSTGRALQETVFHLLRLRDTAQLLALHQQIDFLAAFCERVEAHPGSRGETDHGGGRELALNLQEICEVLGADGDDGNAGPSLRTLTRLCARSAGLLRRVPGALRQELRNQPQAFGGGALPDALTSAAVNGRGEGLTVRPRAPVGLAPRRHQAQITALAAEETGRWFVSGSVDGSVACWRRGNPDPSWIAGAHKSWVASVALSADGSRALSGGDDGTLYLWDADLGLRQGLHGAWRGTTGPIWPPITHCAFLGDGTISVVSVGRLITIDPATISVVKNLPIPSTGALRSPIDAPDLDRSLDRLAVITGDSRTIDVLDSRNASTLMTLRADAPVEFMALAEDARSLAASDRQGRLTVFDLDRGTSQTAVLSTPIAALCRGNSGFFASNNTGELIRIDSRAGVTQLPAAERSGASDRSKVMVSFENGRSLLIGRQSGAIDICDTRPPVHRVRIEPGFGIVAGCLFGEGADALVLEGARTAQGDVVPSLAIADGSAKPAPIRSPHGGVVTGIARLGSGQALTIDKGGTIAIWRHGRTPRVARLPDCQPTACAAWQGRRTGLIGTSREQVIVLGLCKRTFALASTSLEFRAGISALAGAGSPLSVFAAYFNGLVRFRGPGADWTAREDAVHAFRGTAAALSDDCRFAASGNLNGEVQIWECASGGLVADLRLHDGQVTALAFCGGAPYLLSAGLDGQVYALDANTGRTVHGTLLSNHAVTLQPRGDLVVDGLLANGQAVRIQLPARAAS